MPSRRRAAPSSHAPALPRLPPSSLSQYYFLYAGALVFMMQAGFAMLCAGSLREKNIKNIMLKNLLDACVGALGFWLCGYGISYGNKDGGDGTTLVGDQWVSARGSRVPRTNQSSKFHLAPPRRLTPSLPRPAVDASRHLRG